MKLFVGLILLAVFSASFVHSQEQHSVGLSPEEQFARERMLDLSQKGESLEKLVDICSRWDCTDQRLSTEPGTQRTPLLYAAITGGRQQAEFLLSLYFAKRANGPDIPDSVRRSRLNRAVNAVESGKGSSVAMWAMLSRDAELVRMVLSAGGRLTTQDNSGWTALFYAAASDFAAGVSLCLEFAARGESELAAIVNAADSHKRTALHIAIAHKADAAVAELLASNVVDLSLEDDSRQTAFDIAAHRSDGELIVARMLETLSPPSLPRHGREHRTLLHTAAARGHANAVEQILARGFDVDPLDGNECTPLMLAAAFGHREVVEVLLAAGAKLQGVDAMGHSPLMHALRGQNRAIVELLVDQGADTTVLAEGIQTAIDQANGRDIQA